MGKSKNGAKADVLGRVNRRVQSLLSQDREEFFKYRIGETTVDIRDEMALILGSLEATAGNKNVRETVLKDNNVFKVVVGKRGDTITRYLRKSALGHFSLMEDYYETLLYRVALDVATEETLGTTMVGLMAFIIMYIKSRGSVMGNVGGGVRADYHRIHLENLSMWFVQKGIEWGRVKGAFKEGIVDKLDKDDCISVENYKRHFEQLSGEVGKYYAQWKVGEMNEREYCRVLASNYGEIEADFIEESSYNQVIYSMHVHGMTKEKYKGLFDTFERRAFYQENVDFILFDHIGTLRVRLYKEILESRNIIVGFLKLRRERKEERQRIEEEWEKVRKRDNEIKQDIRELKKELKEVERREEELRVVRDGYIRENEKLKIAGDAVKLASEVEKYRKENQKKREELVEYGRYVDKLRVDIEKCMEANNRLEYQYKSEVSKSAELARVNNELLMNSGGSGIPLENILKAIRNKRIGIVGGSSMHSTIRNFKEKNIVLYDGFTKLNGTMNKLDLVVLVTGDLSHSVAYEVSSVARKKGIEMYSFNGQNVGQLFKEVFNQVYK